MIRTQDLTRCFGNFTAVEKLSLEVGEGEIFGFLGPNGAGKTTTIRMLCGLIAPSSGQAWVANHQVGAENEKVRQAVGLLTESPGLYELLNAWDNLLFYARLYQLPADDAKKRVEEVLKWLDLWQWRKDPVGSFSKGMKQKLAIGRTLLHRPQVLFLDEPTASLDAEAAHTIREAIVALKNTRRTIFLSTHNLDEAERLCDRIAIFKKNLIQVDSPAQLRRRFGVEGRRIIVRLRPPVPENLTATLQKLPFVLSAEWQPETEGNLQVTLTNPENENPALIRHLVQAGAEICFVEEQTATLEEVYLSLVTLNRD
ncbi:MAG: ABC transporter ATP-binding protein [Chloroflexota bacterium]|nr:ABC transporter ATP-binding protein [Chloroflexota bacterium]